METTKDPLAIEINKLTYQQQETACGSVKCDICPPTMPEQSHDAQIGESHANR